jgi:hypothetical protein
MWLVVSTLLVGWQWGAGMQSCVLTSHFNHCFFVTFGKTGVHMWDCVVTVRVG